MEKIDRVPTGISGLDELIEGGLPKGRTTLICGGPGAGKTTFAIEFLYNGIKKFGERGMFVTLSDDPKYVKQEMLRFGWNLEELEKQEKLVILDLSKIVYLSREAFRKTAFGADSPKLTIEAVVAAIKNKVSNVERLVIDGITSLSIQQSDPADRRREIAYVCESVLELGCTCLLTTESQSGSFDVLTPTEFQVEEYLTHGVILLRNVVTGNRLARVIQITKMRGTSQDRQPRPYHITDDGIKVFPQEAIF